MLALFGRVGPAFYLVPALNRELLGQPATASAALTGLVGMGSAAMLGAWRSASSG